MPVGTVDRGGPIPDRVLKPPSSLGRRGPWASPRCTAATVGQLGRLAIRERGWNRRRAAGRRPSDCGRA